MSDDEEQHLIPRLHHVHALQCLDCKGPWIPCVTPPVTLDSNLEANRIGDWETRQKIRLGAWDAAPFIVQQVASQITSHSRGVTFSSQFVTPSRVSTISEGRFPKLTPVQPAFPSAGYTGAELRALATTCPSLRQWRVLWV